ncbi:MAG: MerC domain-containing protein [Bacteroidota bacterium]
MTKTTTKGVDRLGAITSGLCAIHCAALPLLFSFGLLSGVSAAAHHSMDLSVLVLSAVLGGWSIYQIRKSHRHLLPIILISVGLVTITTGLVVGHGGHHLWMAVGGCILLLGHVSNLRIIKAQRVG